MQHLTQGLEHRTFAVNYLPGYFQLHALARGGVQSGGGCCPGNTGFSVQRVSGCHGDWTPLPGFPRLGLSLWGGY